MRLDTGSGGRLLRNGNVDQDHSIRWPMSLAIEILFWAVPIGLFLAINIDRGHFSWSVAGWHVALIGLALSGWLLLRLAMWRRSRQALLFPALAALGSAAVLTLLVGYYVLVTIGLESWGRVISWTLIQAYSRQIPELATTVGVSIPAAGAAIALSLAGLTTILWYFYASRDWTAVIGPRIRPAMWNLILLALLLVALVLGYQFGTETLARKGEPISQTIFPAHWSLQVHRIDAARSAILQQRHDRSRDGYAVDQIDDPPHVVIVVIDGLHAGNMGIYGYPRQTMPRMAEFLERHSALVVAPSYAVCAGSGCGHMAIAASTYLHNFAPGPFNLYEILSQGGYRTMARFASDQSSFYQSKTVFRGIEDYEEAGRQDGYYANDDRFLLEQMERLPAAGHKPLMLQIKLMSVHPLGYRFRDPVYEPSEYYGYPNPISPNAGSEEKGRAINYYDNGIHQADYVLDRVTRILREKGYLDNALVVITADHGESLGEEGVVGHAEGVHERVLRVPLVFIDTSENTLSADVAGRAGSQVDIAPTIADAIGLPVPDVWDGQSLLAPNERDWLHFQQGPRAGLIDVRGNRDYVKYWRDRDSGEEFTGRVRRDAQEPENRIKQIPGRQLERYREALREREGPP